MPANHSSLDALGDPTRRAIIEALRRQPSLTVGEIAAHLPVTRPAVSQHLKVLRNARLVAETRSGTRRRYRLDEAGFAHLRIYLDTFWNRALDKFKDAAEHDDTGEST